MKFRIQVVRVAHDGAERMKERTGCFVAPARSQAQRCGVGSGTGRNFVILTPISDDKFLVCHKQEA
jgi:hypothetical protein